MARKSGRRFNEQVLRRKLSGHHALFDAAAGECGDHFTDLARVQPNNLVHQPRQGRIGFTLGRHGDDAFDPGGTGESRKIERQRAVAGNQADGFERQVHSI